MKIRMASLKWSIMEIMAAVIRCTNGVSPINVEGSFRNRDVNRIRVRGQWWW